MGGKAEVYPEKLRKAGQDSGDIAKLLRGILSDAKAATAAGSSAWGDDKFGSQFASGPKGFKTNAGTVIGNVETMSGSFENMSTGQYDSAKALDQAEGASTHSYRVR